MKKVLTLVFALLFVAVIVFSMNISTALGDPTGPRNTAVFTDVQGEYIGTGVFTDIPGATVTP